VTATISVGHNPYTALVSKDGKTVYVSNWGATTLSVVDVSGATPTVTQTIPVGTHPTALLLNPVNTELYVANADSDTISVLDTTTNLVVRTIDLTPFPGSPFGAGPSSLAISSDGGTLYVGNNFDNDIAVVRLGQPDHILGLIPTGWIPSGVVLSPDNLQLAVINSKGLGAGPNLQGPNPYLDPESTDSQYVGSMIVGTMSLIDVPDRDQLLQDTQQVFANDHFFGAMDDQGTAGGSMNAAPAGSSAQLASSPQSLVSGPALLGPDAASALQASSTNATGSAAGGSESGTTGSSGSLAGAANQATTDNTVPAAIGAGLASSKASSTVHHRPGPVFDWAAPLLSLIDVDEGL
jgi:YVTN family beta-propeller protein